MIRSMSTPLYAIMAAILALAVWSPLIAHAAEDPPLFYWSFNEDNADSAHDLSGNGLNGTVTADKVESPSGLGIQLDGTSRAIAQVELPDQSRFGRDSWTFMAMAKPIELAIDSAQKQRRIFSYGKYPESNMVLDIRDTGQMSFYFCYEDAPGKIVSAGGSSSIGLEQGAWAHIALVCDRVNNQVELYINGYSPGRIDLPAGFDGDFALDGRLTIGSGWQNFLGLVDEVKVFRSALQAGAVDAEFERLKPVFGVVESEEIQAAKQQQKLEMTFRRVDAAWASGDMERVRDLCTSVIQATDAPSHFRSYAHLRLAQSYCKEDNLAAARKAYRQISEEPAYPEIHRWEAAQTLKTLGSEPGPDPSRQRIPRVTDFAREIFVSTEGRDAWEGTREQPFATLQRARDAVREFRRLGIEGPMAVTILPGRYQVEETFLLESTDSGLPGGPVMYRALEHGSVIFYGGKKLTGFERVTDPAILRRLPESSRDSVRQCDLRALGIEDYGRLAVRGFAQPPSPPTLELFVNRVPMVLARWPNEGFVGIQKLIQPGSKSDGTPSVFEYISDRHARWTEATDGWLFGYFHFLWADATIQIGRIDTENKTLTTAEPYEYGGRGMSTQQGIQYYAFNLLEEIDMPGEWYLERSTGMLYLYPPCDLAEAEVEIGMHSAPMISMNGVTNIRLENLVFDLGRFNGIEALDCNNCLFLGCTVSRMAGNGIMIHGGSGNQLVGCDVHTIGRRATEVIGGDRETLTPGNHLVENCVIHDFGRIDRTYTPAIQLEGVGNRVAHNLMYNGPSSAMRIEGNDHLIEYNEVHSMVQESDDQGALELFRNATYRGVVFRHNYLHHIGKTGTEAAVHGQAGIRFDDAISGMLVYGNVFYRCSNGNFGAVQMNSGRDNLMDNNVFVDCKYGISGGWYPGNSVWVALRDGQNLSGFYQNELYLSRYPEIATMLDAPGINHLWRNVFYRCGTVARRTEYIDQFENAVFEEDPGFRNAEEGDFGLRDDAELFDTMAFKPIPFDRIGLYESRWRASWPVNVKPVNMPDWRDQ